MNAKEIGAILKEYERTFPKGLEELDTICNRFLLDKPIRSAIREIAEKIEGFKEITHTTPVIGDSGYQILHFKKSRGEMLILFPVMLFEGDRGKSIEVYRKGNITQKEIEGIITKLLIGILEKWIEYLKKEEVKEQL